MRADALPVKPLGQVGTCRPFRGNRDKQELEV